VLKKNLTEWHRHQLIANDFVKHFQITVYHLRSDGTMSTIDEFPFPSKQLPIFTYSIQSYSQNGIT